MLFEERENLLVRSPSFSSTAASPFIVDNFLRMRKEIPLGNNESKKDVEEGGNQEPPVEKVKKGFYNFVTPKLIRYF